MCVVYELIGDLMRIKSFCTLVWIMFFVNGVVLAKNNTVYVNRDHSQFTIRLDSNPTTGYTWSLKSYDKKFISLVSHEYIPPNSKLIGAPGYETWVFQANPNFLSRSQITMISLEYARPWEHGKNIRAIVYKVVSKKN
jgi:inhibitor of cysteine peptidase